MEFSEGLGAPLVGLSQGQAAWDMTAKSPSFFMSGFKAWSVFLPKLRPSNGLSFLHLTHYVKLHTHTHTHTRTYSSWHTQTNPRTRKYIFMFPHSDGQTPRNPHMLTHFKIKTHICSVENDMLEHCSTACFHSLSLYLITWCHLGIVPVHHRSHTRSQGNVKTTCQPEVIFLGSNMLSFQCILRA